MEEDKKLTVDVEAIMREIRADIEMQEDLKNLPDFESIPMQMGEAAVVPVSYQDWALYEQSMDYINTHYELQYYWPFTGNPVKVFLKRVVRKLLKCMLYPLLMLQNRLNAHIMRCLGQIRFYVNEDRDTADCLREETAALRRQVEELKEQVRILSEKTGAGQ